MCPSQWTFHILMLVCTRCQVRICVFWMSGSAGHRQTEAVPSPPPTNIQFAPPERGVKSQSTLLHWENNKYFHSSQLCANLKTPSRQQITVQCITWPVTPELNGRFKKKYPSWFLVFFTFKKWFMVKKRPFKSWDLNLSKKCFWPIV